MVIKDFLKFPSDIELLQYNEYIELKMQWFKKLYMNRNQSTHHLRCHDSQTHKLPSRLMGTTETKLELEVRSKENISSLIALSTAEIARWNFNSRRPPRHQKCTRRQHIERQLKSNVDTGLKSNKGQAIALNEWVEIEILRTQTSLKFT